MSIATLLSQCHQVTAVDIIPEKVDMINNRKSPILDDYIEKYLAEKELNLTATLDAKAAFKIRKFGVSDVIAITAAGKTAFYYVDKEALVKFNGFLAPKAEGSYLILNEGGYQIEGQTDTWKVIDEKNVQEQRFVQLVCEQTKKQKPDIVLHDSGVLVAQTIYGFDSSVMKKIEKFLREQKPELLHHQKFLENGTAERAKESGTEQNYNMIDGCVNNNPKKPRIIGNRISVLDRLHIKLEERKQKSQPQQQQQQERSRKN